jgi:hypothetical protein
LGTQPVGLEELEFVIELEDSLPTLDDGELLDSELRALDSEDTDTLLVLSELNELSLEFDMLLCALGEAELVEPDEPLDEADEPEPEEPLRDPDDPLESDTPLPELEESEPLDPELCELPELDGLVLEPLD